MAAQASHHAPSGRFIRAYLLTWGLLAAGGLTYLASLAWQPQLFSPAQPQQVAEPDPGVQAANKALAEVGSVRRVVTEMQKDLGRLKDTVGQREAEEKEAQARLARLEEQVTTMASPVAVAAPPPPTTKLRTVERTKAAAEKRQAGGEPPRAPHIISVPEAPKPTIRPEAEAAKTELPKIETGSIVAPPAITFGEPEVTPARQAFAVQLAAGPTLDSLRLSWNLLRDRHGAPLASLQPRFIAPRVEGGPYRLLAGPLPSKADADKVCADIRVGKQGCFSTPYIGDPL
jgi:sporulation related protein